MWVEESNGIAESSRGADGRRRRQDCGQGKNAQAARNPKTRILLEAILMYLVLQSESKFE